MSNNETQIVRAVLATMVEEAPPPVPYERLAETRLTAAPSQRHTPLLAVLAGFAVMIAAIGGVFMLNWPDASSAGSSAVVDQPTTAPPSSVTTITTDGNLLDETGCDGQFVDLPRLLLDTDALGIEVFDVHTTDCPYDLAGSTYNAWLQALRTSDGYSGPMFWIETDVNGSDWFRNGGPADEGVKQTWGDYTGYILQDPLRFAFEHETRDVIVLAQGATESDLQLLVEGLTPLPEGWGTTHLPDSVQPINDGPADAVYPSGFATAEYQFEHNGHVQILITLYPGDDQVMERYIYDMASRTGPITIDSNSVAYAADERGNAQATWMQTPEVIASVFINDTSRGITLENVLSSLRVVDDTDWHSLGG